MFSEDDLRDLCKHLKECATNQRSKQELSTTAPTGINNIQLPKETPTEESHRLIALARQIEVLRYNPMLFEDLLAKYEVDAGPLDKPLEDLPLYINDSNILSQIIAKWRLQRKV